MFLELLLAIALGVTAGIITGLIPGIHVNLISVLLLASAPALLQYLPVIVLACFIIAMAVTHSFLDSIPSIFLGAPDAATALGVLPGHRYLLKGLGLQAVKLTVVGSLAGALLSIALFPLFVIIVKIAYPIFQAVMGWLLLAMAIFMVLRDRLRLWAGAIFLLSGVLGMTVLNTPGLRNPLFPLLSGLFGISTLLYSLTKTSFIPEQKLSPELKLKGSVALKAVVSGQASGFLTAMLPGVGAATAAVLSLQVVRDLGDHGYMILQGSITTVNFILSLATLLVIGKARNGGVLAVQQLLADVTLWHVLIFLAVALFATGVATLLSLWFGRVFCRVLSHINYRRLVLSVIVFIVILTPILSGWIGVIILITSTALGLIPATVKTARIHSMGCLLVPVIGYFLL